MNNRICNHYAFRLLSLDYLIQTDNWVILEPTLVFSVLKIGSVVQNVHVKCNFSQLFDR